MKALKAPIILLIILLFAVIFLYGSLTEPFVGDGNYYGRVQSTEGTQWLDTVIRFEPIEGGRQVFTMYNIVYENGEADSPVVSMTRLSVQYTGSYYKHVIGPLFLRPTGLHFPVVDFEGKDKFVLSWEPLECTALDGEGLVMEDYEFSTTPHRSTILLTDSGINFDRLPYDKVAEVPANVQQYMDILDAAA